MYWIILAMVSGILTGFLLRRYMGGDKTVGEVTMFLICLLLFVLGWEFGSDKELLAQIPILGGEALAIALGTLLGSCVFAWLLHVYIRRRERKKEKCRI